MASCSRHQSKVGVGGGASGNFWLQHLQSRLGPWPQSAPAQAGPGLSYLRPEGEAQLPKEPWVPAPSGPRSPQLHTPLGLTEGCSQFRHPEFLYNTC